MPCARLRHDVAIFNTLHLLKKHGKKYISRKYKYDKIRYMCILEGKNMFHLTYLYIFKII